MKANDWNQIVEEIAKAVDHWRAEHPDMTVMELLMALERIRHALTEGLIASSPLGGKDASDGDA